MKYSPYTPEWNRKRYLSEAIETYFKEGVEPKDIVGDILDVLSEEVSYYKVRTQSANSLQEVLDGIQES